jgi:hypothetical protein
MAKKQLYRLLTNTSVALTNDIGHFMLVSYPYRQLFFNQWKEINGEGWSKGRLNRNNTATLCPFGGIKGRFKPEEVFPAAK